MACICKSLAEQTNYLTLKDIYQERKQVEKSICRVCVSVFAC